MTLLGRSEPAGVVSIFVDAGPNVRGAAIDIRNRLSELERRVALEGPAERSEALSTTLRRIAPNVARLLDPRALGRGRALFAPVRGGDPIAYSTQLRLPNRVVLDDRPFVHPLLESLDEGRPAGVVLLSQVAAEVLDWRHGELSQVTRLMPGALEGVQPLADESSPESGSARRGRRRERDQRRRFVDRVAATVARLADARGWERLLVSGSDRLTGPLVAALPTPLIESVIRDSRHLVELDSHALAAAVDERLDADHSQREAQLAQATLDGASGAAGAALGLSEVLAALNDARVAHLVYDADVRFQGVVGEDGHLSAPPEQRPMAGRTLDEPRLTERMVERSLETGARITPVNGEAARVLAVTGGVAAVLRW